MAAAMLRAAMNDTASPASSSHDATRGAMRAGEPASSRAWVRWGRMGACYHSRMLRGASVGVVPGRVGSAPRLGGRGAGRGVDGRAFRLAVPLSVTWAVSFRGRGGGCGLGGSREATAHAPPGSRVYGQGRAVVGARVDVHAVVPDPAVPEQLPEEVEGVGG